MTDKRSYVAICAGVGIGCEGFRSAGFECKLFVEWDEERQDVIRYNYNRKVKYQVPILGDLLRVTGRQVPTVDLWFVTLPCQPFSVGGRRRGLADRRGRPLFDAFIRVLSECLELGTEPRLILFENVPGWLQGEHEAAKYLCGALGDLGFRPVWGEVLNAREFGAPQDRKRVILLFGRESDLPMLRERNRAVGRRPTRGRSLRTIPTDELGTELSTQEVTAISKRLDVRSGSSKPSCNMVQKCREFTGSAKSRREWRGKAVFHSARNPRCFQPGFSPTVTKDARLLVRLPESGQIFKLGPRGYERLMAVKTDLTRYGLTQEGHEYVIKDKHRADMCGDGVCAPVVEWIARAISDLLGVDQLIANERPTSTIPLLRSRKGHR